MKSENSHYELKTFTKFKVPKNGYVIRLVGTNLYLVMMNLNTYQVFFEPTIVGWILYDKESAKEMAKLLQIYFDVEVVEYEKAFEEHASEKIQMKLN